MRARLDVRHARGPSGAHTRPSSSKSDSSTPLPLPPLPAGCALPELWNLMATARATGGDGSGALDAAAKDFAWARLTQHARLGEIRILSAAPPPSRLRQGARG